MSSLDDHDDYDPAADERLKPATGVFWAIVAMVLVYALFVWWLFTAGAPPEYPVRPHQRGMMIEHTAQA